MSRVKSAINLASAALAAVIVSGMAFESETVTRRIDQALAASWRTMGNHLANRELTASARELDRERQDFERIGALRDELDASLQALAVRRRCVATRVDERPPRGKGRSKRELLHVDSAIAVLRSALARADVVLDQARDGLREHDAALTALRAAADASRADRMLAAPIGDQSLWNGRVECVSDFLRKAL